MKKILTLLIITSFSLSPILAQNNSTKKADKLFDRLEYVKAAQEYLKLAEKSPDNYVISRLADAYYNIFNTKDAEKWYAKIINDDPDAEIIFRYAEMLKANGKYKESNIWMSKFSEMKPYDTRAIAFRNTPNYLDKIIKKGKRFNVQNLKDINTISSDFGAFTFDNALYLTSGRKQKGSQNKKYNNYTSDEEYVLDVFKYDVINDVYINETPLEAINTKYHEGVIAFSPSGDTMYFARETYYSKSYYKDSIVKNGSTNEQVSVINLYRATRCTKKEITWKNNGNCNFNKGWNVTELEINSAYYSMKNPALSCDGKSLYFSSDMPGGFGNYDIFKSEIKDDGSIGEPINLGQKINTEEQEVFPHMCCDNTLYFSSNGHLGLGGLDVFYSKNVDGKWSNVRNVGLPVNSNSDDFAFKMGDDCTNGFVSSNRAGGAGSDDVYAVKKIKPLCDILLESIVVDAKTDLPIDAALTSVKDNTGIINNSKETSEEGLVDYMFECEDEIQLLVSKEGYESKMIDIKVLDIDPPLLKIKLDPIEELIVEEKIVLNPIYFEFDKANITNQAAFELDKLVSIMKKYPKMIIRAESHTDSRGPASYNKLLSERRAKSTAQYVISKGIDENRISGFGMGEEDPKIDCSSGCSKDEYAKNRRSEFIIVSR
jgi:outer membrane protein OmpA-like peptidoglycan-associated protein/tetratricopeptide (TPR) repeat protein